LTLLATIATNTLFLLWEQQKAKRGCWVWSLWQRGCLLCKDIYFVRKMTSRNVTSSQQRKFLYRQSSGRNVSISFDLTTNDSLNCSGVGAIGI
jgi:hypothetical protein